MPKDKDEVTGDDVFDIDQKIREWAKEGKLEIGEWPHILPTIPNLSHNNKNVCAVMQTIHLIKNLPEKENIIKTLSLSMLNTHEIDVYMIKIFKIILQYQSIMDRPAEIISNIHWIPKITDKFVRNNLLELFKDNENLCRNIRTLSTNSPLVQKKHKPFLKPSEESLPVGNKDYDVGIVTSDITYAP